MGLVAPTKRKFETFVGRFTHVDSREFTRIGSDDVRRQRLLFNQDIVTILKEKIGRKGQTIVQNGKIETIILLTSRFPRNELVAKRALGDSRIFSFVFTPK